MPAVAFKASIAFFTRPSVLSSPTRPPWIAPSIAASFSDNAPVWSPTALLIASSFSSIAPSRDSTACFTRSIASAFLTKPFLTAALIRFIFCPNSFVCLLTALLTASSFVSTVPSRDPMASSTRPIAFALSANPALSVASISSSLPDRVTV